MNSDTKVLLSAILGTAVAVIAVVVTLVSGVRADMRNLRAELAAELRELRSDMREDHARFDSRLDAVEVELGKVGQRLLTIERVVLPGPDADE